MSELGPTFSVQNSVHGLLTHPKEPTQFVLTHRAAKASDLFSTLWGELRVRATTTVHCCRDWFQVVRIDASWIPTEVIQVQSFRNFPVHADICESVDIPLTSLVSGAGITTFQRTVPDPTSSFLVNCIASPFKRIGAKVVAIHKALRLSLNRTRCFEITFRKFGTLPTTALTESEGDGRLKEHWELPFLMPRPGAFLRRPVFSLPQLYHFATAIIPTVTA